MSLRDRYPLRPCWLVFWAALFVVVAGAYVFISFTGQWEGSLTNTLLALVDRYPWAVGVPLLLFLIWLLLHFAVPIVRRWCEELNKED